MAERFGSICIFCGSSAGVRPAYSLAAARLGRLLAGRGIRLIYGGSHLGLMGVVADACLEAGGNVTGVMPRILVEKEAAHLALPDLRVVESMHERKALMAELSDAFIALPGGYGTFEELCEAITWSQLGVHRKPCGLLNVAGYYDPLLALFDHAVAEGFLKPANRGLVVTANDPEEMLEALGKTRIEVVEKWIDRAQV